MAPYAVLVFLNNFFMYKIGFNKIEDEVLVMLLLTFICFFFGGLPTAPDKVPKIYEEDNKIRFERYNIKRMTNILLLIGLISFIKLIYLCLNADSYESWDGAMGNGIVGHLLLLAYSILPIVFLYWTYNKKKKKCIIAVLMIIVATFSTFIKYNVLGLAVSIFIFVLIYKKSMLKKAVMVLVSFTIIAFVGNYAISFFINNESVSSAFYLNHFWVYCSGSIINANNVFLEGMNVEVTLLYKLATFLFALPNMFFQKFLGERFFPYMLMEFNGIGELAEQRTNVLDAISYLYPSKGDILDIIIFAFFILAIGFLFSNIYMNSKKRKEGFNTFVCNFMTFFVFFSFFGTFYINSGPWEILVYSLIIPRLFIRKKKRQNGELYEENTVLNMEKRDK